MSIQIKEFISILRWLVCVGETGRHCVKFYSKFNTQVLRIKGLIQMKVEERMKITPELNHQDSRKARR